MTLNGDTAVKRAIMCENIGLIRLQLTFGGSPCPNEWCIASELCTDLAYDLLHFKEWNPLELHSPHMKILPPPIYLYDSVPYASASGLDVHVSDDDCRHIDDFR
jgi:hypothetical protein